MSIRHGLLALLERGQMYGYQLRAAFEESTGSTWPLNIGQVYTTLSRLERDGLAVPLPASDTGQRPYSITEAGRADRPDLSLVEGSPGSCGHRPAVDGDPERPGDRAARPRDSRSQRPDHDRLG